ncbi:MAG: tetratricopeptide repeat protein [Sedimenticola sp.]
MSDSELEIAAASYSRGDWKDAFNRYKELAETGCVECQRFVGWMYFRGEGVNVDLEKAMYWLKEAAQAGDQEAAFGVGRAYMSKQEYETAYSWYKKGAEEEFLPSIYWIARFNRDGYGVKRDEEKAFLMFKLGASLGHLKSLREYSIWLLKGSRGIFGIPIGFFLFVKLVLLSIRQAIKDPLDYKGMI